MEQQQQKQQREALRTASLECGEKRMAQTTPFSTINDDLLLNIVSRLPAVSFASAACVSRNWSRICNRILSRPRLSSALSLNPSPQIAMGEVLEKVLAEPIRPHFAIANVSGGFRLAEVLKLMKKKLGSKTPVIVTTASGIIGRDSRTDEFKEVKLMLSHCYDLNWDTEEEEPTEDANGIVLTVGFVPGLKVDAIPLVQPTKELRDARIEKLAMDIIDFTSSASGSINPVGIVLFGEGRANMKPVMDLLDFAMPVETVVVGCERSRFLYSGVNEYKDVRMTKACFTCAIALVFANDKDKSCGMGNIQFSVALSNGLSTVGPKYKAASVRVNRHDHTTWLTARAEGNTAILDGQEILDDINRMMANRSDSPDIYIGVTTRRNFSVGSKKPKLLTSLAFHGVVGGDEEYLYVDGNGIKTGDYFQFYHSDPATALSSCSEVTMKLKNFKYDNNSKTVRDVSKVRKEVFGGLVFGCYGRGESFFKRPNVDSSPFLENFPQVPVAGVFCGGEIARSSSSMTGKFHEKSDACCCLHVYSTVYLIMSYTPSESEF